MASSGKRHILIVSNSTGEFAKDFLAPLAPLAVVGPLFKHKPTTRFPRLGTVRFLEAPHSPVVSRRPQVLFRVLECLDDG